MSDPGPVTAPQFAFDNSYARELDGFYVPWQGDTAPAPRIVAFNDALARDLGLDPAALNSPDGAAILTGSVAPEGALPLAQAYAGHQFGGFSPQLGDGRALLLGEVIDRSGARRDLHLKGSGRTPFSRGGDGKAVLGPVLREYLMGEAMQALAIPTTRALAACTTGEDVPRDGMKPGAVLARIAASHLRVGTFQFFAARGETDRLRQLADYAIARHDPDLAGDYLGFLAAVAERQARLIAAWMGVGFVHGVMNTDNMTISGETIDYGPCAFVDAYDPNAVFSSIDHGGRYALGNQPSIAQWNLARLAETLLPVIDPEDQDNAVRLATNAVNGFRGRYLVHFRAQMAAKIGLGAGDYTGGDTGGDTGGETGALIDDLLAGLAETGADFTGFFRALADVARGDSAAVAGMIDAAWLDRWLACLPRDRDAVAARMDAVNPLYIPRNHLVEAALQAAERGGDFGPFNDLLAHVTAPFDHQQGAEAFAAPAPADFGPYRTFCGT